MGRPLWDRSSHLLAAQSAEPRCLRETSQQLSCFNIAEAHMETARQFITVTPAIKADRNGTLECWSPSSPRVIVAAAVTTAVATCSLFFALTVFAQSASDSLGELLVGKAAFGDWRADAPLVRRKITELPPPYTTRSASNPPRVIAKPVYATPKVPPGFHVELFASNLRDPRTVRVAPNGDIFIAES